MRRPGERFPGFLSLFEKIICLFKNYCYLCDNKMRQTFNLYTMANRISDKMVKAFERFNADLKAFGEETGETFVTLYEDAFTTRRVANFRLYKNGNLKWIEIETGQLSQENVEMMFDDDDAKDWLSFWRANLRRAKRYWSMNTETLDKIQDGEIEDKEEED